MSTPVLPSFEVSALRAAYQSGALTPGQLVAALSAEAAEPGIFIHRVPPAELARAAAALEERRARGEHLPLYGIPFAVKDNIDVAGLPTTAACPAFAFTPAQSAPVVERLEAAGALMVGKTNLDQFATGLVGTRSPYGVPSNPFDPRYITGGSSSGSAAAVSRGLASFALGTDTAGSGRVPAAFTNLVGLKPSGGLFSTRGVVPACRSLDCVSVFALTAEDASEVASVLAAYDSADAYSRPEAAGFRFDATAPTAFRFAVPAPAFLEFFGDQAAASAFAAAVERVRALGGTSEEVDFAPFLETAALLYDGPWIAERLGPLEDFVERHADAILPVTLSILREGAGRTATQAFLGHHRLAALRQVARALYRRVDTLVVPTAPSIYKKDEIAAEPRLLNARLGRYVNFVNLLEMAGVAVPNGFRPDGLPTGITFLGPWGSDARLLALAGAYHRVVGGPLGASGRSHARTLSKTTEKVAKDNLSPASDVVRLAVVGAHLSGQPLNHQLTDRGARLVRTTRTAGHYRLYALPGTTPPKPGLVRVGPTEAGGPIEVEVWDLPRVALGGFFPGVVAPLTLGTLVLEDGEAVVGFLCEAYAIQGAVDITAQGGWRAFRASKS